MMATAFSGYVLPWGQMSFWGATVISSMITVVPYVGKSILEWIWGGYTVNNATLTRFYSLHYVLPFVIAAVSLIHLTLLHKNGSNNPVGSDANVDNISFYPYFFAKDLFAFFVFLFIFAIFVLTFPNTLNHPDNYIQADPMETPAHVVPEWYFLPFYAILRSIPHKAGGIIAMGGSIFVLFLIPFTNSSRIRNTSYRPIFKICYWILVFCWAILMWIGQCPVEDLFAYVGQVATLYYYTFFIICIPMVGKLELALSSFKN